MNEPFVRAESDLCIWAKGAIVTLGERTAGKVVCLRGDVAAEVFRKTWKHLQMT